MSSRLACLFLCLSALAGADTAELASSLSPSRAQLLAGQWTYDVWNLGAPDVRGEMRLSGAAEKDGGVTWGEYLRLPDESMQSLWLQESISLDAKMSCARFTRIVSGGNGDKAVELSRLEGVWAGGLTLTKNGGKGTSLDGDVQPDALIPAWLTLLPLDRAKEYRLRMLSHTGGMHAAAARLTFDGEASSGGKKYARWSLRLLQEDPSSEWKWWMDEDGRVASFRSGAYEGARRDVDKSGLALDGDLSPRITITVTGEKVKDSGKGTHCTFEDASYRRGAVVAMKTGYSGDESAHGRVMDVQRGDRVVAVLRHFDLGNAAMVNDAWSVTLALSLPALQDGRIYDLTKGEAEGILHYGVKGMGQVELISRIAKGTVKVVRATGAEMELELSLSFEGFFTGQDLGRSTLEIHGTATALLAE